MKFNLCGALLPLLTALPLCCAAQATVKLKSDEVSVDAFVSQQYAGRDTKIEVTVDVSNWTVPFNLDFQLNGTENVPGQPTLTAAPVSITKNGTVACQLTLHLSNLSTAPAREYTVAIVPKDDPAHYSHEGAVTIRIVPEHGYHGDKPFWMEIGANFDLASQKIEANNLFGGVFLYQREIRPLYHRDRRKLAREKADKAAGVTHVPDIRPHSPLAIAAGVYESKYFSQQDQLESLNGEYVIQPYYTPGSYPVPGHPDSFLLFNDTGMVKFTKQIRSIGLFFSPQVRLTNKSANENGLHFFFSVYSELLWQNIQTSYDYTATGHQSVDTLGLGSIGAYRTRPGSRSFNIYAHYDGVGFPVFLKEGTVNLYLNPVYGITNQPSDGDVADYLTSAGNTSLLRKTWTPFYLIQFRLSEERYGISFSGEVRQLLGSQSKPFVTLVLSKKFDLTKLIEFNGN